MSDGCALPDGATCDSWRRPARYQPLVIVLAAVAVGIVVDRHWPLGVCPWCCIAGMAWLGWLVLWRLRCDTAAAVALLPAIAATAGAWHHLDWSVFVADDLGRYVSEESEPICLDAVVLTGGHARPAPPFDPMQPVPAGPRVQFDVAAIAIRDRQQWRPASGRARLVVYGEVDSVRPGDRVRILGHGVRPPAARNPGEFDYADHLRADRILTQLTTNYAECVSVVEPRKGMSPTLWLAALRERCGQVLRRNVPAGQSALAEAVLLGARERIDPDEKLAFVETGTVHLLAISGLHVGILIGALWFALRRSPLPSRMCILLVMVLAIGYMLLVDTRPPVVRATVLMLVCCASEFFRRPIAGFNSLAAAALMVLAVNPSDLFHTGAQLSFLAVAAVIWVAPLWSVAGGRQEWLRRAVLAELPWARRAVWLLGRATRQLLVVSLVIWCVTTPLAMTRFHVLAPAAVPLNPVLCGPMTVALVGSFATLLLSPISELLSRLAGAVAGGSLGLLQGTVELARWVPGSHLFVPGPPAWWLAGFYGGLALLMAVPRLRPPRRWCAALAAAWIAAGLTFPLQPRVGDRPLRCTFVALGHGLSVLVELPDGRAMLYDAGHMGPPAPAVQTISAVLWSRGITHLDAVFLSHGDLDHYNALPGLLGCFSVGKLYMPPMMYENRNPALDALERSIGENGVAQEFVWAGARFAGGDCRIEVLHPPRKGVLGSDNANSLVLAIEYAGRRILLTGDLESPGLDDLIAEEPLDCDALLAPHHGGRRSNTPELARWCTPEWVIVSGAGSSADLRATYEAAGAEVLSTAELGAVSVEACSRGVRAGGYVANAK